MDLKQKDMQYLGIFDIFRETHKIINANRKIFALVALCFVHPLNYGLSAFMGTLNLLFDNLIHHISVVNHSGDLREYGNLSDLFSHKWPFFWPFNVFYILFLFSFSVTSTSGVVYTVACINAGREVSPKHTMSVVAKVWKRLLVTFLCVLLAFLAYNLVAGFVLFLIIWTTIQSQGPFGKVDGSIFAAFLVLYCAGISYLGVVLQLSGTVSVLEGSYGFKAMARSRSLLKGKMMAATVVVFVICLSLGIIQRLDVVLRKMFILSPLIALASLFLLLLILIFLLWKLVLETMLYFVCKSYHHENIDMPVPSDHLPLRSTDDVNC